jgi:N6-adenosine-specific RNA methylase IME4
MYRTYFIDPPWPEFGGGKSKRGADRHYALIRTEAEMLRVIEDALALHPPAEAAHMYMCVTANYLEWGLRIMAALGFTYKTQVVWVKVKSTETQGWAGHWARAKELLRRDGFTGRDRFTAFFRALLHPGLGQYFRGSHELVLFGTRGRGYDACTEHKDVASVVFAPKTAHSAKPAALYLLVERRSLGPYVEFFARTARPGWTAWGDQAPAEVAP